jgi:hypothetical protein
MLRPSVQSLLSSRLLSRNVNIKIYICFLYTVMKIWHGMNRQFPDKKNCYRRSLREILCFVLQIKVLFLTTIDRSKAV